jgi:Mg-chelatase subunit ChlD
MRVRHKIPSIFNLSMVDVLCCALGCVILLWLLNLREAKEHEDDAARELLLAGAERDDALKLIQDLAAQIESLEEEKTDLRKKLNLALATTDELNQKVNKYLVRVGSLEEEVKAREKAAAEMAVKNDEADRAIKLLRGDLKTARDQVATEEGRYRASQKEVERLTGELASADKALKGFQTARSNLEKELDAARPFKEKWAASEARLVLIEKQLRESQSALTDARGNIERLKGEAENRFEGIVLTGKRVVFLVDMSGSMKYVDAKTDAPGKWEGVRNTVAKIMRSLPDLEKFQVIVFAEKTKFLLGKPNDWLDYKGKESIDTAFKALKDVDPDGGTNMYSALEAAFALRAKGLDTIYLLSDGLPNEGEGVAADVAKKLKEVELSDLLAKYIRKKLKDDWNRELRNRPKVRINTIGFFYESPDVGAFLWALARENDGSFVGMSKP